MKTIKPNSLVARVIVDDKSRNRLECRTSLNTRTIRNEPKDLIEYDFFLSH